MQYGTPPRVVTSDPVVIKPFSFNGKDFKAGQSFPWRKLGCPERKLQQMLDQRRLGTAPTKGLKAE